jgi:ubiquinone/menaquinone biosynthesis C-methylase UbiE
VLDAVTAGPGTRVVDLGSGNGQISLPLAQRGATVLAIDVSPAMVRSLREQARREGASTLHTLAVPIEELVLPDASVDLVVSSYALHHLRDADKARLISSAARWLRPGGRIVLADMMLGRGGSRRDRKIIRAKLSSLARKGPGGWWRIAKNAVRYLLRIQERPVSAEVWVSMMTAAGFIRISSKVVIAEACVIEAQRPALEPGRKG